MKKILLFAYITFITFSLSYCTSDSATGQSLTFKINGVQKTFKVISSEATSSTILVYGYIGILENPTEDISFSIPIGTTINPIYSFIYTDENGQQNTTTNITSNASTNTANYAKGTFSGTVQLSSSGSDIYTITEGRFSIRPQH